MNCGTTNDSGVDGYFVIEDLSDRADCQGIYEAGIYFPHVESGRWDVNFKVTITDGENEREESIDVSYFILTVYNSGRVVVDRESYNNAVNELLAEGEWVSEFTFSFAILVEDGSYIDHRFTVAAR